MTFAAISRYARFLSKHNPDGMNKSSSGIVNIIYDNDYIHKDVNLCPVFIEINAYDILDWPRTARFGPFEFEQDAIDFVANKLNEARNEINKELIETGQQPLKITWEDCLAGTINENQ